jgi:outer membrane protein assembly factor BamB
MILLLTLFIFQQNPTYAVGTWTKYGATLENTHLQYMKGAMMSAPDVKWSYKTGGPVESFGAAVADIDKDDTMEVLIGSEDYKIYCLNGTTGGVKWSYTTGDRLYTSSPAIADMDKDDTMEVVIGSEDNKIYCLNGANGTVKWSYTTGGQILSSPAIADINNDDTLDVLIGSTDDKVYCLNGITGEVKWSYLTAGIGMYISSPAVADVNKDDTMEVVIGSFTENNVYCLNGTTGRVKWSYFTGDEVYSSPAIADVDKDDTVEVVFGCWNHKVYCLNGTTGKAKWSYSTGNMITSSPAIADIDNDDTLDVLIGSSDHKVYCLNGTTGNVKWSYVTGGREVHRGISIADIDMDNKLEVLLPNAGFPLNIDTLFCLNGEDGSLLWEKQLGYDIHDITVADIDNDGCVELIIGTNRDSTIWALDDIGNFTNCGCMGTEEKSKELKVESFEFKVIKEKIYLSVPNTIEADIKLYDLCGRLKENVYSGTLTKGNYTFIPKIQIAGIYFINLKIGNYKETKKLILIK